MRLVIADTAPINYLVLIGHIEILQQLFERVILPSVAQGELEDDDAPLSVRVWISNPPIWVDVRQTGIDHLDDESLAGLDDGEKAAISLATALKADLLLMDDREGVRIARRKGFEVTGTLGILALAARRGLIDLTDAFNRLKGTNFRYQQVIMNQLLDEQSK